VDFKERGKRFLISALRARNQLGLGSGFGSPRLLLAQGVSLPAAYRPEW